MIHALDRVAIATPRLADAARAYAIVLGRSAREDEGGASFALTNVRLDLVADQMQPGLVALSLAVDDLDGCERRLTRRHLPVERPVDPGSSTTSARLLADRQATYGVPIEFYARPQDLGAPLSPARPGAEATAVTALDPGDPHAQSRACHCCLRQALGAQLAPRPEPSRVGRAALVLSLWRAQRPQKGDWRGGRIGYGGGVGACPTSWARTPDCGRRPSSFRTCAAAPAWNPGLYGPLAHGRRCHRLIGADADAVGLAP